MLIHKINLLYELTTNQTSYYLHDKMKATSKNDKFYAKISKKIQENKLGRQEIESLELMKYVYFAIKKIGCNN